MTPSEPDSDWRPRPNDHLVEPFFGGLEVEGEPAPPEQPRRRSAWRRWGLRLGLMLFGCVLCVALFELYVRAFDPLGTSHFTNMKRYSAEVVEMRLDSPRLFAHRPNAELAMHGWTMRTDRHGLRGPDVEHPKPAEVRRILFLGDSVTFGWGLREEETFPAQLAAELNAAGSEAPERFESINAGHLQHDTTQEAGVLAEVGFLYEPEIVCLVWCGNDTLLTRDGGKAAQKQDPEIAAELQRQAEFKRGLERLRPVVPASVTFLSHVYTRWQTARFQTARGNPKIDLDHMGVDRSGGWAAARASILEMREACAERGVAFCVLSTDSTPELGEFCAEQEIPFAAIHPTRAEREAERLRNSNADPHLNGRGNAILARNALQALREWGWLP